MYVICDICEQYWFSVYQSGGLVGQYEGQKYIWYISCFGAFTFTLRNFFFKWNMKRIYRNCQNVWEFFDVFFGGSIAGSMFFISNTPIFIKLASIFLFLYFKSPFFRYNIKKSILRGREIRWLCNRCVSLKYLFH